MVNFDMAVDLREGGHHSGNWGGLLANPAVILAHALVSIVGRHGQILVPEIRPDGIPEAVRRALADIVVTDQGGPQIDPNWGEPDLSLAEKVYGWNTFEVLSFITGNPDNPVNAIPPRAVAHCQIRFVVGKDPHQFLPDLRRHLDEHGFHEVEISLAHKGIFQATRVASENPWVRWSAESIERSSGQRPVVLPNLGGSLPNDAFTDILGMPTIWVPHSYAGCSQHAPNEHLLEMIAREGLKIMTGLFWDLGDTTFGSEFHSINGSAR
jgi:acetylornithine deacetylase/succinyl-diaminopimelate desuccinylase-like protein